MIHIQVLHVRLRSRVCLQDAQLQQQTSSGSRGVVASDSDFSNQKKKKKAFRLLFIAALLPPKCLGLPTVSLKEYTVDITSGSCGKDD